MQEFLIILLLQLNKHYLNYFNEDTLVGDLERGYN